MTLISDFLSQLLDFEQQDFLSEEQDFLSLSLSPTAKRDVFPKINVITNDDINNFFIFEFIYMMKIQKKVILGSNSPRRKEILSGIGIDFEVKKAKIEEIFSKEMDIALVPIYLSKLKAEYFSKLFPRTIIICADTVVICDNIILGKPKSKNEAIEMLNVLNGNSHKVITGVTIYNDTEFDSFDDVSEVYFKKLTNKEIEKYVASGKCYDKAGGYGVQDEIGMIGIEKIIGSYYNVMGLPIHLVYEKLKKLI